MLFRSRRDDLGREDLFCTVLLCILAVSSPHLLLLLGPYHFYPLLRPSLHEIFPWYCEFLGRNKVCTIKTTIM